ncbi:Phosphoribosylformylglycinamidine synthase subunit PurL [Alienimonas californiensis]|uniref:Phosphoribosylformylglycinamidine synthase subunit PurL n=1 Tax=Alienimonas californiensis TaxID=2527989 RepID=A0A517PD65_9PLAN|nr:phosphoribosylformylglycinamidine synthase subunit PurL [Alienimonas californiensis]QDT17319.1 Phosphoribosylformylglycinamidine synthase subunit PurL [Alienimonas californiensis]
MLWDVEIRPAAGRRDAEAERAAELARGLGLPIAPTASARSFLIEGDLTREQIERDAVPLLADPVVETARVTACDATRPGDDPAGSVLNVLYLPGVTDNVARSAKGALERLNVPATNVASVRKYWVPTDGANGEAAAALDRLCRRVLANDSIEHVLRGPLRLDTLALGKPYQFQRVTVPLRTMDDDALMRLSKEGQLSLSLAEMRTVRDHFAKLDRDPTDCELESVAQTWSEHCSHKTLAGPIQYAGPEGNVEFRNMLKETIFAATVAIRKQLGADDWCRSVFADNAGVVHFEGEGDAEQCVCIKVETHNHPSAIEPYGGANTGLGGVIRDPLGTGLGAKPLCSTDVFCFASPDTPADTLPPGVLHPATVMAGVVAGVRDYGNRMGIPTVNGAVCFDDRYLGNPLVFCGNVALIPADKVEKKVSPGDRIVALGGATGRDGIHGATFSSVDLHEESESVSGGAVQIGDAVTEKMVADVLLAARDRGLYSAVTDCGAGGFSSAVGEMGEETGAEVHLDRAPLKYPGLSPMEIWISEAQERMVFAVPPGNVDEFVALAQSEGVGVADLGEFTGTGRLVLKYEGNLVADVAMEFLHDGRPHVVRQATYAPAPVEPLALPDKSDWTAELLAILAAPNVASKEFIVRQYDQEVQAHSVIKPLVGEAEDGPGDAAVIRPLPGSQRGLAVGCGINPRLGDLDTARMAESALDEAVRNVVAVGADPSRIAVLDNFCWGNTERPETLGSLVRSAIALKDYAVALGTPFVSGKDSLYNEFAYTDADGQRSTVAIPPTLLVTAMGQVPDSGRAVTMDLKEAGNPLYLVGETKDELGGSHLGLVLSQTGGAPPTVAPETAPTVFVAVHKAIAEGCVRACHDLSEGGLAAAAAEMAFAGGLGAELSVDHVPDDGESLSDAAALFSESNTRFLMEVAADQAAAFERHLADVPHARLGAVTGGDRLVIRGADGPLIEAALIDLKAAWQSTFAGY